MLSSVPGTEEAKDAVLIAQIPTVMEIDPKSAAAQAKVSYNGDPQFAPIEGTSLSYATNTADKVIRVGDVYYLCLQGVWFMSPNAQGPWTTASSVPQVIYTIPPSSPVYNVTYVTQTTTSSGTVECSHTAGYLGAFVIGVTVGAVVANGTGYYYPPYMYYPPYGYPVYRPYPMPYGYYGYGSFYSTNGSYGVIRPLMVRMAQRPGQLRIIRTPARTNRALPLRLLTAGKALGRLTTPIPEPMSQRIKGRVLPRSGANPMCRMEINPLTRSTTRPHKEP